MRTMWNSDKYAKKKSRRKSGATEQQIWMKEANVEWHGWYVPMIFIE